MNKLFVTIEEKTGPALLALLMLVLCLQVLGRMAGFGAQLVWTDEAARHLFVWSVFLSMPLASKKAAMVHIKLSEKLWPGRLKTLMPRLTALLWAVSSLALAILCFRNIMAHSDFPLLTPILGLNENQLLLAAPCGFFLVFIRGMIDFTKGRGRA